MDLYPFDWAGVCSSLGMSYVSFDFICVHTNSRAFFRPPESRCARWFPLMLFHNVHRKLFGKYKSEHFICIIGTDLIHHTVVDSFHWIT